MGHTTCKLAAYFLPDIPSMHMNSSNTHTYKLGRQSGSLEVEKIIRISLLAIICARILYVYFLSYLPLLVNS